MGSIVRLILSLFRRGINAPTYLSEVSKTIEIIPVPKRWRWLCGGLLHLIPVAVGIAILFIERATQFQHGMAERAGLLFAGSWGLIGPALIWYYERRTLPRFLCDCRRAVKSRSSLKNIRALVYSNVFSQPLCIVISALWIIVTIICFFRVSEFVNGFGVSGMKDWLWWMLFIGVLLYAYYTSLGFCFIYKTISLTRMVVVSDIDIEIYNEDGVFGFSFIGEFALRANLMFLSGIVFLPLMLLSIQRKASHDYVVVATFVGTYIICIIISFIYPIYNVHKKIIVEKRRVVSRYFAASNGLIKQVERNFNVVDYYMFLYYKGIGSDVYAMREWPLNADALSRFTVYAVIIPIVVGILTTILTPK